MEPTEDMCACVTAGLSRSTDGSHGGEPARQLDPPLRCSIRCHLLPSVDKSGGEDAG